MANKTDKKELEKTSNNKKPKRDKKGRLLPGNTANPKGRPEGSGVSLTTEIKNKLLEVPKGEKTTYLQQLIQTIIDKAITEKDHHTIKQIWNYLDGMPKQSINLEGKLTIAKVLKKLANESRPTQQDVADGKPVQDNRQGREENPIQEEQSPDPFQQA